MDLINPEVAEQIFNECDIKKKGALTVDDFRTLSQLGGAQFTDHETAFIFEQLDVNKDGLVTKEEFVNGFARALNLGETKGFSDIKRRGSLVVLPPVNKNVMSPVNLSIDEELSIPKINYDFDPDPNREIPCQEEVLAFYGRLQSLSKLDRSKSGSFPDLLTQFEKVIEGMGKEFIEQRNQNERLQNLFNREKIRHNQQIDEVENNLASTLSEARERARREEREKLEREKEQMCQQFETELAELKATVSTLQKSVLDDDTAKYQKSEEMRQKVQDLSKDNLRLRHNLAEKQTELALIQTRMARLRQNYDDKLSEWSTEKDCLVQHGENMSHQLQLIYEANKQLHDTNDNLRTALEARQAFSRQLNLRTPSPIGSGGRMSPVVISRQISISGNGVWSQPQYRNSDGSPNENRPNHLGIRRRDAMWLRGAEDSMETDEDIDSGMITRGSNTTCSADSAAEDDSQRRLVYGQAWDGVRQERNINPSQPLSNGTILPQMSLDYSIVRTDSLSSSGTGNRSLASEFRNGMNVFQPTEPTGPPERTFRIVLVGDASVGKTSLIRRLVKEEFHENSSATIGVEYQSKCIRVDGRNVALQLWDTAGQEKFRSLCKAYFRKADGAILAYDSTCEQSFLNVRDWLNTVQESVNRKIPVMLCANKIDLRITAAARGQRCISRDDGENLAKIHNILFVETSAKDGTNVCEAAVYLTRELLAAEDFEVRSTCVVLEQKKKSTCTSCKS